MRNAPFHLAIPVTDLPAARAFYGEILGCREGRSDARWVDFDLAGHQLVAHMCERVPGAAGHSHVDGVEVPVPHFGLIVAVDAFNGFAQRLRDAGVKFVIEPRVRFAGKRGEQHTMFFLDPFGNALEIKALTHPEYLFEKN